MPALDFPSTPAIGDKYPPAAVQGVPSYIWDGEKWTSIAVARAIDLTGFLPLHGGTLSGPLILYGEPTDPLEPGTKQTVDGKLALDGGVMTGPLRLDANPTVPLGAATKQMVDANTTAIAGKFDKTGGGLTGDVTIAKTNPGLWLNKPGSGTAALLSSNSGGKLRWQIALGDSVAEAGGGAGSNFNIIRCNDGGGVVDAPIQINRATGAVVMALNATVNGTLNTGGAATFPSVSVTGGVSASGGFACPSAGNGLSLMGISYIFADGNYFGIGESGAVTDTQQWRYMFARASGARNWSEWGGRNIMYLVGGGNLTITGTLAQASDAEGKTSIAEATDGIEAVRLMQPRTYHRIHPEAPEDHPGWAIPDREELGFIAQEMQAALPKAVRQDPDGLSIELMPIIAALVNAVKQFDARLTAVGA